MEVLWDPGRALQSPNSPEKPDAIPEKDFACFEAAREEEIIGTFTTLLV